MARSDEESAQNFTFLNYHTPKHNASHRRVVKSHISSKYRTAIRQQAEPRYALPQRPAGDVSFTSTGPDDTTSLLPKRAKQVYHHHHHHHHSDNTLVHRPVYLKPTISPLTISFSGLRTDPFDSLPAQRTPCVTSALDYYVQVLSPLHEPLLTALNLVNPMMTLLFPLIISHPGAYHAAVALSQAYFEKRSAPTADLSSEVHFHRRRALAVLNESLDALDGAPDDGMLLTVLALASLDVLLQRDLVTNRKGLALIVALKGGLDRLGSRGLLKSYLIQFDYFWMLETGDKSIFPLSKRLRSRVYPRQPFSPEINALIDGLPPGFAAIALEGGFGVDVLRLLSRVNTYLCSKKATLSPHQEKNITSDDGDYPDIFDACACLQSSSSTENSLEKNTCLAIIVFCFLVHSPDPVTTKLTAFRGPINELTRSLPLTKVHTAEERSCLLWIWTVALGSCNWNPEFEVKVASLNQSIFETFEEATEWRSVEAIMRHFFWYEPLLHVWKFAWQKALDSFREQQQQHHQRRRETQCTNPQSEIDPGSRSPTRQVSVGTGNAKGGVHPETDTALLVPRSASMNGVHTNGSGATGLPPMLTLDTYVEHIRQEVTETR